MKLPNCKKPCSNCPFRKDSLKGWLGEKRIKEILEADTFVCHKTTKGTAKDRLQCAGHMLLVKEQNSFYRLAARMGIDLGLSGSELIFPDKESCIKRHKSYD